MTRALSVAACLLVSLSLAACGSGKGSGAATTTTTTSSTSPQAWATGVCSAITTWEAAIRAAAAPVTGGNVSSKSILTAVQNAEVATTGLVGEIKNLGPPDTSGGQQAQQALEHLGNQLQAEIGKVKTAASNGSGLSAITAVAGAFTTMSNEIKSTGATLEKLHSTGLVKAFQTVPACKSLVNG